MATPDSRSQIKLSLLHARHELHELKRYDLQVDVAQSHDDHVALQLAPSPLPQLLGRQDFVDFCGVPEADQAPGPAGAATEAPASQESAPEPAAGAGRATKTSLSAEVCSRDTFRIVPDNAAYVPQEIWRALTDLDGSKLGASRREWYFPLPSYRDVMEQLKKNELLARSDIEPLPPWLLRSLQHDWIEISATEANASLQSFLTGLPPEIVEERPVMEFQKQGILFGLARGGRCLLGDEMGLGKTLQALAIVSQFQEDWPVLVVAPSALRMVWRDQALTWLPLKEKDVQVISQGKQKPLPESRLVIASYELVTRNKHLQLRADGQFYQAIILDEAHYIKDPKSKRTGAALPLCRRARRCVLISGTPAVNRAAELYTQLQVLLPEAPAMTRYYQRYCEQKEQYLPRGIRITKWVGAKRKAELNTLLTSTVMVRRLKSEVLHELPKKRRQRITLDPAKLDSTKLKEIGKFLKVGVDFEDDAGQRPEITEIFKKTAEAKAEAVGEYVEYLLNNEVKFLLFGHHHVLLDSLEEKLKSLASRYIRIDGHTPQHNRPALVEEFQSNPEVQVALLSITACGQGLTLTAAHTVVFAELYWVPGQMLQAEDRVHRIGQTEMVDVHYCIAQGSLDERVYASLNKKSRDTSGILDGKERHLDASQAPAPSMKAEAVAKAEAEVASPKASPKRSPKATAKAAKAPPKRAKASPKPKGRPKRRAEEATGISKFFKKEST
ncbi:unnamed protein product [Effrenium voratum]|uniref:Uncharacterized protein n=1 Tax=Effrenium voratum TaxID=2562239 RepID=A0AA36IQ75_9DINO|nr:unnamed protein product [Effrenium voratum]CAJ1448422.1 unnamed protein product [Effrenium voratum]